MFVGHKPTRNIRWSILHSCVAVVLACNYFAFQVELFDAEYEENHPAPTVPGSHALSHPTLTWESFDKNNAPKAFVVDAGLGVECLAIIPLGTDVKASPVAPYHPVRDKSPPDLS